jgi:hypothetical protein
MLGMRAVAAHWRELPPRERKIVLMRFYDVTQTEIAQQLGISQMHVSRLLTRALGHLRPLLFGQQDRPAGRRLRWRSRSGFEQYPDTAVARSVPGRGTVLAARRAAGRVSHCQVSRQLRDISDYPGLGTRRLVRAGSVCGQRLGGGAQLGGLSGAI